MLQINDKILASEVLESDANESWSENGEESRIEESKVQISQSGCSSMRSLGSKFDDSWARDLSFQKKRKGYINLNIFSTDEGFRSIELPVMKVNPSIPFRFSKLQV